MAPAGTAMQQMRADKAADRRTDIMDVKIVV